MAAKFITLAIHTYDYAVGLRRILKEHGVDSQLENVDMNDPKMASGVRVRIDENNLPLALKLVESQVENSFLFSQKENSKVLVPIDFSPLSLEAARIGFYLAELLSAEIVLMHVYATPYFDDSLSRSESFVVGSADAEVRKTLKADARNYMRKVEKTLRDEIVNGILPAVRFSTSCVEGLPEEAILDYARTKSPLLIVMGTRGADKKASDMMGSVTAEVVDSCRVPVFTVPENFKFSCQTHLDKVVFFCNLDHQDLLAMDTFLRLSTDKQLSVTLIPVNDTSDSRLRSRMEELREYLIAHYPMHKFFNHIVDARNLRTGFEEFIASDQVTMIVVPNKKKNIFSRLFNPGIAHKIIFEKDLPMLVLPV